MNETPCYFSKNTQQNFAIEHAPVSQEKNIGWVFCHPFAEEKLWSHRVYVNIARDLANLGYPVLRFDYRGYGDSDGAFEEFTIEDQIDDIQNAISVLQENNPELQSIGLIGLRYGATLASLAAEKCKAVSHLVLWDPLIDLDRYMQDILRANLTTQLVMHGKVITKRDELTQQILNGDTVNVDGYELTRHFFESAIKINLLNTEKKFKGTCLITQIGRANQALKKDFEKLAACYENADLVQVVEEQFWKEIKNYIQRSENLTESLLKWINEVGCEKY